MIREFEFFHGLVFARILHATQKTITIKPFKSECNSSYVVNNRIGVYIKYSAKRMSPWRFTFRLEQQREIEILRASLDKVFLVLVCSDDGIVCLSYTELVQLLDKQLTPIEWISASRRRREMYAVKGSNGELDFKIGQSEFPGKMFGAEYLAIEKSN